MARAYPQEFRDDVVAVARKHEAPLSQIAKDFGISDATLANWLKRADIEDGLRPGKKLTESDREREQRRRMSSTLNSLLLHYTPFKGYNADVSRLSALPRIQELTQDQWGLVTRRQMVERGIGQTTIERLSTEGGALERVATGVYRIAAAPPPDHLELRAAWLQLAPGKPAWSRTSDEGIVSHRSAASMYGIGDLPADIQEFTMPRRRQTQRRDVRIHVRKLTTQEWIGLKGLPVTRPSRIASDLLSDNEDPEAIARLIAESIRLVFDYPGTFADQLARHASHFGLRKQDGLGLLRWLLELTEDKDVTRWMAEARAHVDQAARLETGP